MMVRVVLTILRPLVVTVTVLSVAMLARPVAVVPDMLATVVIFTLATVVVVMMHPVVTSFRVGMTLVRVVRMTVRVLVSLIVLIATTIRSSYGFVVSGYVRLRVPTVAWSRVVQLVVGMGRIIWIALVGIGVFRLFESVIFLATFV